MTAVKAPAPSACTAGDREAAWKYVGYPGFSSFIASSRDFFAIRRFGSLNTRSLLKLQNDIVEKERRLSAMDEASRHPWNETLGCGSLENDSGGPRAKLLDEIGDLLKEYNERLLLFFQVQDRPSASPDQIDNVRQWLVHYQNAIEASEQEFLQHDADLVTPRRSRRTHFGRWMQTLGLFTLASTGSMNDSATKYYDWNVWKSIGGLGLLTGTFAMLLGPLWAMPFAESTLLRLVVVTATTVGFSFFTICATVLKPSHRSLLTLCYFAIAILMLGLVPTWHTEAGRGQVVTDPSPVQSIVTSTVHATVTTIILSQSRTTSDSVTSTSPATATPAPNHPHATGLSTGALVGIVIGVVSSLGLVGTTIFLLLRKRRLPSMPMPIRSIPVPMGDRLEPV